MHCLVFEADHTGHRLNYVRLVAEAACAVGCRVTVVISADAIGSAEYQTHLASMRDRLDLDASCHLLRTSLPAMAQSKQVQLRAAIARHRPDHVFVPYADQLAQLMGLRGIGGDRLGPKDLQIEGLLMRGGFAYPSAGWPSYLKQQAFYLSLAGYPWTLLHHIDPIVYNYVQKRGGRLAHMMRLCPDPVEPPLTLDKAEARRQLRIPEDGRYVGTAGALDSRKGVDLLIRAFARAKLAPTDRLLLVGKHAAEIRELLDRDHADLVRSGRIICLDSYVGNEQLNYAISAMDVVAVPYPRHIGSVSIAIRATAAGRPVLASDFGWLGYVVPLFQLGQTLDVTRPELLSRTIVQLLESASEYRTPEAASQFVAFHTVENFKACWMQRICTRLGQSPAVRPVRWPVEHDPT